MTKIEWANPPGFKGEGWPVVTGCTPVSPGCANCYAARLASGRLRHQRNYKGLACDGKWIGEVRLDEHLLNAPLHWRDPRCVFVCHTSDLFHSDVPFEFIDKAIAVMVLRPHHRFLLLTKRPHLMADYWSWTGHIKDRRKPCPCRQCCIVRKIGEILESAGMPKVDAHFGAAHHLSQNWPLPNVALGTSIEDQQRADERIPLLLQCPAAMRFISVEPMLGPVNLHHLVKGYCPTHDSDSGFCHGGCPDDRRPDWVIIGCESGPKRRPCDWHWMRNLLGQCQDAGVPAFVKQVPTDGRIRYSVSRDPAEWPTYLRVRQWPKFLQPEVMR